MERKLGQGSCACDSGYHLAPRPKGSCAEAWGWVAEGSDLVWEGRGEGGPPSAPSQVLKGLGSCFPFSTGRWIMHKPKVASVGKALPSFPAGLLVGSSLSCAL